MTTIVTWLIRYGHVVSGAIWVGGYALLALVIVPQMRQHTNTVLNNLAITAVRVLTYSGMATIFFGVVLITRTRGIVNLLRGEWGAIVLTCIVIAVALLGVGDGALRPALRRLAATGEGGAAQRFAWIGLGLTVLAVGLMTRALYAQT